MVNKGQSRLSDAMAAEEGARARIAADIHDDTIQTLGAVALSLQNARDDAADPDARAALDAASWHVRDAANRLRRVMFELMPPLISTDLRGALEAFCEVLFAGSGMACEVAGEVPETLDPEVGAVAYRVAQEAARNALRHSGGTHVRVALEHPGTSSSSPSPTTAWASTTAGPTFPSTPACGSSTSVPARSAGASPSSPAWAGGARRWW